MKKIIVFGISMLVTAFGIGQTVSFGVKTGINVANVSTNFSIVKDGQKAIPRVAAGAFLNIEIGKRFSLQPQLIYSGKGLFFDAGSHSHTILVNAIDMPILGLYKLWKGFYIGAGPNCGYNLSGKNIMKHGSDEHSISYKFNNDPFEYKRFDFGINTSIGYEHKTGIGLSINYLKGLNNVANMINDYKWKSNVLSFSATYKIKRKKNDNN